MTTAVENERDTWARENQFLILSPGEAYERAITKTGSVFIYRIDNGRWVTVYDNQYTYNKGRTTQKTSIKAGASRDSTNIFGTTWEKAVSEADRFVRFMQNNQGRRKKNNGAEAGDWGMDRHTDI